MNNLTNKNLNLNAREGADTDANIQCTQIQAQPQMISDAVRAEKNQSTFHSAY